MSIIEVGQATARAPLAPLERETDHSHGLSQDSLFNLKVDIYDRLDDIAPEWQAFEKKNKTCLYQSYQWTKLWQNSAASAYRERTIIVAGRNKTNEFVFIWPFAIQTWCGLKLLTWSSQGHANFNFGPTCPHFARTLTPESLKSLLHKIAAEIPGLAAASFTNQPFEWDGQTNPFRLLPHYPSPNLAYQIELGDDFDALFNATMSGRHRSQLRRKEKRLGELGALKFVPAHGAYSRRRALETFFEQKAHQFAEAGIKNIFSDPALQSFYYDLLAERTPEDGEFFELYCTCLDDDILATMSGIRFQNRFHLLLLSLTKEDARRWSPGLIGTRYHVEHCIKMGDDIYDFGTGSNYQKQAWSNSQTELFDSFIPLSALGHGLESVFRLKTKAKRVIKSNDRLWKLAQEARKKLSRFAKPQPSDN